MKLRFNITGLLLTFLTFGSSAQNLTRFVVPAGYVKVLEARGDLDKDGVDELVYAYNTDKKEDDAGFFRTLYICKTVNGETRLWKKNTSVLWKSKDCGFCIDKGVDLSMSIKNNTLLVKQTFNHNSRHYSTYQNIFRFQNKDWFLIGSTYNDYDTCDFDFKYDINFSTGMVNIAENYGDCDEGKKIPENRFWSFKYPFKSIPKMDGFTAGKTELKVPDAKKFFYY
ncbi:hypothetical protein TH53_00925 [Pedobacter lusitanus]|uniref:VCBS repeat-containing protein n=1 Tax=Pedobacter lusitanus TaxID=1503925 RepID=A0A0D0FAQ1_9SPHI|nr:hypothetical protein [Pedobacter lusitanus]KIO78903.1 hypothetical protein TH53_00925 [Pedobacter lusitanus]